MAGFPRTNGDLQGVAVYDVPVFTNNGANAVANAVTVQPQGPKLNFFTATAPEFNTTSEGANVQLAVQTVQQLSTIHMYEWTAGATNGTLAMALYPTAGQTAASIQAALVAAGLTSATVANAATFTAVS